MDFTRSKYGRKKRKKKRLGEYKETGFLIYLYVDEEKEKNIGEKFMNEYYIVDSFIQILISKGMHCAGGGTPDKYSFFVDRTKKAITDEERNYVMNEAKKIEGVDHVIGFDLVDVWYSNSDSYYENADRVSKEYLKK